jgi:hypothetical protein
MLEKKYNDDWVLLDNKENSYFLNELNNEINEKHLLYNRVKQAIMRRLSEDDVLYLCKDGKYVIIHLTYSEINETGWPQYKEFSTFEEAQEYIKSNN